MDQKAVSKVTKWQDGSKINNREIAIRQGYHESGKYQPS